MSKRWYQDGAQGRVWTCWPSALGTLSTWAGLPAGQVPPACSAPPPPQGPGLPALKTDVTLGPTNSWHNIQKILYTIINSRLYSVKDGKHLCCQKRQKHMCTDKNMVNPVKTGCRGLRVVQWYLVLQAVYNVQRQRAAPPSWLPIGRYPRVNNQPTNQRISSQYQIGWLKGSLQTTNNLRREFSGKALTLFQVLMHYR